MSKHALPPHYVLPGAYGNYPGSKATEGVYQTIINQMPPHDIYVEPFAGGAGIFRKKALAQTTFLGDVDHRLLIAHAEAIAARSHDPDSQLRAVRESTKLTGSKGWSHFATLRAAANSAGDPRGMGSVFLMAADYHQVREEVLAYRNRLSQRELSVCWYFDPPYPSSTIQRKRYANELSDREHEKLLIHIKTLPGNVLISTYPNELYRRELRDWRLIAFTACTHGKTMTEWLFCNFEEPAELHDYGHVGGDYRERAGLKKKKKLLEAKLSDLPTLHRNYLLAELKRAVEKMPHVPMPTPANRVAIDAGAPVVSRSPIPAVSPLRDDSSEIMPRISPDKTIGLEKVCRLCSKETFVVRDTQKTAFAFGATWQHIGPGRWRDRDWLCSMACIEAASSGEKAGIDEQTVSIPIPANLPVAAATPAVAPSLAPLYGHVWVTGSCNGCGRAKRPASYPDFPDQLSDRGFVRQSATEWRDPVYTCSDCIMVATGISIDE
jgi:DNA adenine methylase